LLNAGVDAGNVSVGIVLVGLLVSNASQLPPSNTCHCTVGAGMPPTVTANVANPPRPTDWFAGFVTVGGESTVSVAAALHTFDCTKFDAQARSCSPL
jgi:hypothetical protein